MYERLIEILKAAGNPKVLLVGDFMLDNYVYGDINRISPEAPVMVLSIVGQVLIICNVVSGNRYNLERTTKVGRVFYVGNGRYITSS